MRGFERGFAAVVCVCATVAAQRTWIVDASAGPGHHFTDIPIALVVALDGDTLVVRPGAYTTGRATKSLTILGEPGAFFSSPYGFVVDGLGANKTFVLAGMAFGPGQTPLGTPCCGMQLVNSPGRIHLDRLVIDLPPTARNPGTALLVRNCAHVTMTDVTIRGFPGLRVDASVVSISGGTIESIPNWSVSQVSEPAIDAMRSILSLSRCSVTSGRGWTKSSPIRATQPAIRFDLTELVLAGDGRDRYAAGAVAGTPTPALVGTTSRLWLGGVNLIPNPGAVAVGGSGITTLPGVPLSMHAQGAPPGGVVQVEAVGTPGEILFLLVGLPAAVVNTTAGRVWMSPPAITLLGGTTLGAAGSWRVGVPIPNITELRGLPLALQTIGGNGTTVPYRLSDAAVPVIH